MMLGFKKQFEKYVEDGSKRHSIREKGGRQWRPGMVADCFVNPRQKSMRCLGRWTVTKVQDIRIAVLPAKDWITFNGGARGTVVLTAGVWIDGVQVEPDELGLLAWRDGFRGNGKGPAAFVQMMGFWKGRLPFEGDLIHWDYDHPVGSPAERKPRGRKPGRPRVAA
jgi:hypothetical protein